MKLLTKQSSMTLQSVQRSPKSSIMCKVGLKQKFEHGWSLVCIRHLQTWLVDTNVVLVDRSWIRCIWCRIACYLTHFRAYLSQIVSYKPALNMPLDHVSDSATFKHLFITNRPKLMKLLTKQSSMTLQSVQRSPKSSIMCKVGLKQKFEHGWSLVCIRHLQTWLVDTNVVLVDRSWIRCIWCRIACYLTL